MSKLSASPSVSAVETLRHQAFPEWLWVRVETEDGLVGLGETLPRPRHVEAAIHERLAPLLLGRDVSPSAFFARATQAISYNRFSGAEVRAVSAIEMALWDIVGQRAELPLAALFGGPHRTEIRTYNTCVSRGRFDDHTRTATDPTRLAIELRDEGFAGMKIWPFDDLSIPMDGQHVDRRSLAGACRTLAAIREAVGDELEIAIEGHSCWSLPAAIQIAKAVEEFRPLWLEDFLQARNPRAWRRLREETGSPICGSERLFTRWEVEPFLREGAVDVVSQDVAWTGGIAEARTVAAIAELYELPLTLHCCHGPVATAASVHVAASVPNIHLAESIRGFVREIHPEVVETPVAHRDGRYLLPADPGLGVQLRDSFVASAQIQRSQGEVSAIGWTAGDPWSNDTGNRI